MSKKRQKAGKRRVVSLGAPCATRRATPAAVRKFCCRDDVLQCKGEPYPIKRFVCWARQKEGRPACRSCPERVGQLYMFGSPRQIL